MKIMFLAMSTLIAAVSGCTNSGQDPNALQIISAQYGADANWIDVTKQVRAKVKDNELEVTVSNELGGDPIFGLVKKLIVKYKLDGVEGQIKKREGQILRISKADDMIRVARSEDQLLALAKNCPGKLGFFAKNLKTGKIIEYRANEPACMASMVKVYVLLEIMKQAELGRVDFAETVKIKKAGKPEEECTINKAMFLMIAISDNEATNALAAKFGYDNINALPKQLGLEGVSEKILPEPGILNIYLDKRVYSKSQNAEEIYPQHATARGMAQFYELLCNGQMVSPDVCKRMMNFLTPIEREFAPESVEAEYKCVGKGGSLTWMRPFRKQYNMTGWAGIAKKEDTNIVFCIWSEFFPPDNEELRLDWLYTLTDSMIAVVE